MVVAVWKSSDYATDGLDNSICALRYKHGNCCFVITICDNCGNKTTLSPARTVLHSNSALGQLVHKGNASSLIFTTRNIAATRRQLQSDSGQCFHCKSSGAVKHNRLCEYRRLAAKRLTYNRMDHLPSGGIPCLAHFRIDKKSRESQWQAEFN